MATKKRKPLLRLDGDFMMIRPKDAIRLLGIMIIALCAVWVCALFMNFNIDVGRVKDQITDPNILMLYDAQVMNGKVTSAVSGGCLLLTSVVMLFFYIKHYIDTHKSELGILKALGYSNLKIARGFWVFGLSVGAGAIAGFGGAFAMMPTFYRAMNDHAVLPNMTLHFNFVLIVYLILLPTLAFALLAVIYSFQKMKRPPLELIRGKSDAAHINNKRTRESNGDMPFLKELRRGTVRSRYSLIFFIAFSAFCYSAMTQMSFSMRTLSNLTMALLMIGIGLILAFTTLFLAVTTVIKSNTKTIAMMRVFGYADRECGSAIFNGYRPIAWIGFAIGTGYQFGLLKVMVSLFTSQSAVAVPAYNFDVTAFFIALFSFAVIYEAIMYIYTARIKRISLKEIMLED